MLSSAPRRETTGKRWGQTIRTTMRPNTSLVCPAKPLSANRCKSGCEKLCNARSNVPDPPPHAPRWALNHPTKERIMSKCMYCGSSSFGPCSNSPHQKHEHSGLDEKKCVFCGSSSYGSCSNSPFKKHKHGSGNYKCVYCGSTSTGSCSNSPHGKHEK